MRVFKEIQSRIQEKSRHLSTLLVAALFSLFFALEVVIMRLSALHGYFIFLMMLVMLITLGRSKRWTLPGFALIALFSLMLFVRRGVTFWDITWMCGVLFSASLAVILTSEWESRLSAEREESALVLKERTLWEERFTTLQQQKVELDNQLEEYEEELLTLRSEEKSQLAIVRELIEEQKREAKKYEGLCHELEERLAKQPDEERSSYTLTEMADEQSPKETAAPLQQDISERLQSLHLSLINERYRDMLRAQKLSMIHKPYRPVSTRESQELSEASDAVSNLLE